MDKTLPWGHRRANFVHVLSCVYICMHAWSLLYGSIGPFSSGSCVDCLVAVPAVVTGCAMGGYGTLCLIVWYLGEVAVLFLNSVLWAFVISLIFETYTHMVWRLGEGAQFFFVSILFFSFELFIICVTRDSWHYLSLVLMTYAGSSPHPCGCLRTSTASS